MKKYIIIVGSVLCLMWAVSCKKALTENLHSSLTSANFYKTESDAQAGLNGVFSNLTVQTYYQRTVYIISDLSCDIFRPNNANSDRQELYTGNYSASNGQLYAWWLNSYATIKNANDFLVNVPNIQMDATAKNDLLGNALFIRGLAYFELTTMFGALPLVLKNDASQNLFPSRTSPDSIYNQVISDLQFAESNCNHAAAISSNYMGRVSSEAATTILARVYLQRASTSFAKPGDSQSALTECNKLIAYSAANPNYLALESSYKDLFDVNKKNGPESIFAVQFSSANPASQNITNLMFDPADSGGFASFLPLDAFVSSFDPGDLRKAVNVGTNDGGTIYISKYRDPNVNPGGFGGTNFMILRYADVLLMQSEALNNVNAGDITKFNGINAVRTRAGLSGKLLD